MSFNMYIPTRVLFGAGQLNNLHTQKMPGKKAMVVISNGKSTKANGYLARTEEQLYLAGVETVAFDKVEANPLKSLLWPAEPLPVKTDVISLLHWVAAAVWRTPRSRWMCDRSPLSHKACVAIYEKSYR